MAEASVESVKKDEILEAAVVQLEDKKDEIEKKVDEVADKAEDVIEKVAEEVGKKVEDAVMSVIDKLDDNPQVAKVLDVVEDAVIKQLDGREVTCSCFGWLVALRITRKIRASPPSKSEDVQPKTVTASPSQDSKAEELPQAKAPQQESV
jgi:hypothetical protein